MPSSILRVEAPEHFAYIDPLRPDINEKFNIVAAGYSLTAEMLYAAYFKGVFPWSDRLPILWFFTNPRMVLKTQNFKVSHSLKKRLRDAREGFYRNEGQKKKLEIFLDREPEKVLAFCAEPRDGQDGTWIQPPLVRAYLDSMEFYFFHTIGCYVDGELLGGLFFDSIGRMFYGESMFTRLPDLSKIALAALVSLAKKEDVPLIDCQQETKHLSSLGAAPIDKEEFCRHLAVFCQKPPIDWPAYPPDFSLTSILGLTNSRRAGFRYTFLRFTS